MKKKKKIISYGFQKNKKGKNPRFIHPPLEVPAF
jgi:hypothetical protein